MEKAEGLCIECRSRSINGHPQQFPKKVEEDLLAEVQRERILIKIAGLGSGESAMSTDW